MAARRARELYDWADAGGEPLDAPLQRRVHRQRNRQSYLLRALVRASSQALADPRTRVDRRRSTMA